MKYWITGSTDVAGNPSFMVFSENPQNPNGGIPIVGGLTMEQAEAVHTALNAATETVDLRPERRAKMPVSVPMMCQLFGLPGDVGIIDAWFRTEDDSVVFILEGAGLPERCIHSPNSCLTTVEAFYQQKTHEIRETQFVGFDPPTK